MALNILVYGSPTYVIIHIGYKLHKMVQCFGPPTNMSTLLLAKIYT